MWRAWSGNVGKVKNVKSKWMKNDNILRENPRKRETIRGSKKLFIRRIPVANTQQQKYK